MSNALTRIVPWGASGADLAHLQIIHTELAELSPVSRFLIYGDPNFAGYLAAALTSCTHAFTRLAGNGGERTLCHLRIIDGVTFVNNIYLAPDLRGDGRGSLLLAESLRRLAAPPEGFIELDAFESNLP